MNNQKLKIFNFVAQGYSNDICPISIELPEDTKFALSIYEHSKPYDIEDTYNIWTALYDPDGIYYQKFNEFKNSIYAGGAYHLGNEYTIAGLSNVYVPQTYLTDIKTLQNKVRWDEYIFLWFDDNCKLSMVSKIKKVLSYNAYEHQRISIVCDNVLPEIQHILLDTSIVHNPIEEICAYKIKRIKCVHQEEARKIYDTLLAYAINKQLEQTVLLFDEEYLDKILHTDYVWNYIYGDEISEFNNFIKKYAIDIKNSLDAQNAKDTIEEINKYIISGKASIQWPSTSHKL